MSTVKALERGKGLLPVESVVREGLSEDVALELRSEGSEGASAAKIGRNCIL